MTPEPLVSVIVPTWNSQKFLSQCLASIAKQTYPNIEVIVVDNYSQDQTVHIARCYTQDVFVQGPERSAQVNFGVTKARGQFVYKVDSDFVLESQVVEHCVAQVERGADAVVVHNSPDTSVGWIARIRKFEVDMYKYDLTQSSARFVDKEVFLRVGGFDESITAGEDYDFQARLIAAGCRIGFIEPEALHLGEPTSLRRHMLKFFAYGQDFVNYRHKNQRTFRRQLRFVRPAYVRNWRKFIGHPILGATFVAYDLCKYAFGAAGFLSAWIGGHQLNWRSAKAPK